MKLILNENQCAYLMKDGVFQKLLFAGKHRINTLLGYTAKAVELSGEVNTCGIPADVLMANAEFAASTVRLQIPDDCIAVHSTDGMFSGVLTGKDYLFWNVHEKHTFQLLSLQNPEDAASVPAYLWRFIPARLYHKAEVGSGETALLYFDNQYQRSLSAGTYWFWSWSVTVTHKLYDLKIQQLEIGGQEILTADKVGVRLNLLCGYRITDPVELSVRIQNHREQLYAYVQLAARALVGRLSLDELLARKDTLGTELLKLLQAGQDAFCVEFSSAGIKDIILPGEIREIMNTVLVAEKNAQANVITRREEVASTRSLLNTARLMDENHTLYRLKELEYLEKVCDRVGNISLNGAGNVLEQLSGLLGAGKISAHASTQDGSDC
ncbi:slipin family protein [Clostridiaceae bacterium NSJ-31]|uniref:Slipin family protein n=1 Tax=Ligaoa zhengdingensis TaxID=2763658 RepID=A0A926DY26_9FIRM|nr:slipin family protein [Ligaoa zhengdingensis]MBC8545709.1 slipin family protein [Ligaoa zhengdingensis]